MSPPVLTRCNETLSNAAQRAAIVKIDLNRRYTGTRSANKILDEETLMSLDLHWLPVRQRITS